MGKSLIITGVNWGDAIEDITSNIIFSEQGKAFCLLKTEQYKTYFDSGKFSATNRIDITQYRGKNLVMTQPIFSFASGQLESGFCIEDANGNTLTERPFSQGESGTETVKIYIPKNAATIIITYWNDTQSNIYGAFNAKVEG